MPNSRDDNVLLIWKVQEGPVERPRGGYLVFAMVSSKSKPEEYWTQDLYFSGFEPAYKFCGELLHKMEPIEIGYNEQDEVYQ